MGIKISFIFSCFFIIILSFKAYAKQSCDQFLKECLSNSETIYKECLDNKILADFRCESMGYKPYSKDFRMCVDSITSYWERECKKSYHQYTEGCYNVRKKCRKGDILGIVNISFKEKSDICSSAYIERQGFYSIIGFWKKQPSESYGFIQSFKAENPHILYVYNETALDHNENCPSLTPHTHDCPILVWYLQDASAKIYEEPRYDSIAFRIVIRNIPGVGSIYQASLPGMLVNIKGKKIKGNSPPECTSYDDYSRQISVGSFSISDDVSSYGEMKGSESWKSCGNPFKDKIGFGIGKDKLIIIVL